MRTAPASPPLPRLFAAADPALTSHQLQFGVLPEMSGADLVSSLDAAGLRGRGGAAFPAGRKLASVSGRKPVVVANGAEGEPLSSKDAVLLTSAPHLVLDGVELAARAVGAHDVYLYLHEDVVPAVKHALQERRAAGLDRHRATVVEAPDTFVAGEESALIRHIEGGPALPRDRTEVTAVSGVRGRPTLVNNVETLAHIALIARFGPRWFRSVGARDNPGSMLVTLSGAVLEHGVVEVPTGASVAEVLWRSGATDPNTLRAVLVGGYHGSWIAPRAFDTTPVSGAGIVHALGRNECGLARTAAIADYLAAESARQCGPCRTGLPRIAHLLGQLAHARAENTYVREIRRLSSLVDGRGACRHPDGTARFVRSALETFAGDIEHHHRRRCEAAAAPPDHHRGVKARTV